MSNLATSPFKITGVPYPAKFDLPTDWTDTTFKLSWKVNCSIHAPIINYQLEFRELPHGHWVVINVPSAQISHDTLHHKGRQKSKKKANNEILEFKQSYTIKGLTKGSSYQAKIRSRNEFGLSAETILDLFQTFDIRDVSTHPTTNIFQKISYFEEDNLELSSTIIDVKKDKSFMSVNSEPLSTIEEKGQFYSNTSALSVSGMKQIFLEF